MMEQNNRPKWLVPVGIGCVVILCLCLLGAGGFYFLRDRIAGQLGDLGDFGDLGNIPGMPEEFDDMMETAESITLPTEEPMDENPAPPQDDLPPANNQYSDQTGFFDDFSSQALDWDVRDDGITVLQYESQAYSFQINEPDYLDYVWLPTLFDPTTVRFEVWGPAGEQGGTVGVECRVQTEVDDYYYIEFELSYQDVFVGGYFDGGYVEFHQSDNEFGTLPLQNMNASPDQPNVIEVTCNPDTVLVTVNGMLEHTIDIPSEYQIWDSGPATFFVYTYENTMAGYKVFFDNVEAYP